MDVIVMESKTNFNFGIYKKGDQNWKLENKFSHQISIVGPTLLVGGA